ncbi:signal peptide peptidase SppA [bacterium]|nr:signal peptide peptidase SppA [bacterium]
MDVYTTQGPSYPPPGGPRPPGSSGTPSIVINNIPPKQPWLGRAFTRLLLIVSILANIALASVVANYFSGFLQQEKYLSGDIVAKDKIALIEINTPIMASAVDAPIKELDTAEKDKNVRGVILRINSPGGEVFATDRLYRAITKYKQKTGRPVVALMESVAASGAFWIAMPADKIIAAENCITGSIGVIMQTFVLTELLKEWGVKTETFKTGDLKDSGSMFREMNDADKAEINKLMTGWYTQFLGVVNKHRGDKIGGEEKLKQLADGRVFLGPEAKTLGLVDEIGYLDDAIEATKSLAAISGDVRVIRYQRQGSLTEILMGGAHHDSAPLFSRESLIELQLPQFLAMPQSFLGGVKRSIE